MVVKPFETKPATLSTKQNRGFCIMCAAPATTVALFHVQGAVIIQRYCEKCLPEAKYDNVVKRQYPTK